jgi:outer membrane protein assembly factor BamB
MSANRRRSAGLALAVAVALAGMGADWPQFLGPKRDGTSAETGLLASWPKKGPPMLWEKEVGEGFSGPVVAGDRLILFHRVGPDEVVECLEAATGKFQWKSKYESGYIDSFRKGNGPRSTPLVAGGKVYTLGAAGVLQCLELESGKKVWSTALHKEYEVREGFFGVGTSPVLEGELLLVNVGGKGAGIVAFHKDTGKEVWKATDQDASYASPVVADVDGVRQALFFTHEGLVSLDPKDGTVRWSKRWRARINESVNAATPIVTEDLLFASASYGTGAVLLRVKKASVEEVWKGDEALSCHYDTPVLVDGFLYGCDGRQESRAELRCVELKTGKVRWGRERYGCASLIAADGNLIGLSEGGDLVLIEPTPREYVEKARANVLTGPCRAAMALANGRLYARDGKRLVCWNLRK